MGKRLVNKASDVPLFFYIKFFAKTLSIYSIRYYEKEICTWSITCLVDESFVPLAQQTSILYCRFSDFRRGFRLEFATGNSNLECNLTCIPWTLSWLWVTVQRHSMNLCWFLLAQYFLQALFYTFLTFPACF